MKTDGTATLLIVDDEIRRLCVNDERWRGRSRWDSSKAGRFKFDSIKPAFKLAKISLILGVGRGSRSLTKGGSSWSVETGEEWLVIGRSLDKSDNFAVLFASPSREEGRHSRGSKKRKDSNQVWDCRSNKHRIHHEDQQRNPGKAVRIHSENSIVGMITIVMATRIEIKMRRWDRNHACQSYVQLDQWLWMNTVDRKHIVRCRVDHSIAKMRLNLEMLIVWSLANVRISKEKGEDEKNSNIITMQFTIDDHRWNDGAKWVSVVISVHCRKSDWAYWDCPIPLKVLQHCQPIRRRRTSHRQRSDFDCQEINWPTCLDRIKSSAIISGSRCSVDDDDRSVLFHRWVKNPSLKRKFNLFSLRK